MATISSDEPGLQAPLTKASAGPARLHLYYLLFFLSGFPALIYQIVWQRALFTLYGTNIESVTMIVTVFMLGLGLGSLAGGWLSSRAGIRLLMVFGLIEMSVGAFGFVSLGIFHRIASITAGVSTAETGVLAFAMLLLPTMLMGSTLPLLVEFFVRRTGNVGESVGALYAVNTFGSAAACLAAALFLMRRLGESGSVRLAVCFNLAIGITALLLQLGVSAPARHEQGGDTAAGTRTIPFRMGMLLAGGTGFIALAYEIVWYRLFSFASVGTASCFAALIGFYLFGIAAGSILVYEACRSKLMNDVSRLLRVCSEIVVLGAIAAFLVGPALAHSVVHVPYVLTFGYVSIAAALLGSAFPLLAHAAIASTGGTGARIGWLYLSNIIGSTLGSLVIGFVVANFLSIRAISVVLLALGVVIAGGVAFMAGLKQRRSVLAAGCAICAVLGLLSGPLFSGIYERLLYKNTYKHGMKFADVVENRNGVITVSPDEIVWGGGAYDGRFNTDLVHDSNGLFRAFAFAGLHSNPKKVLIIGLSSGSWAQIVANDSDVQELTIVEINPGYLQLIRKHANVRSLLFNPKVKIVIDDGRRWLVAHPDRKFDFIMMNTTFNWRANTSNLLSTEFMSLLREHLSQGGVAYYNTTSSSEALATGATDFPYALRIFNFIAVSDSPVVLNNDLWRAKLTAYKIDGRPVLDLSESADQRELYRLLHLEDEPGVEHGMIEDRASMLKRFQGVRRITDNNMGNEW